MPTGFHRLHPEDHINFQLNRWHAAGYIELDDARAVGASMEDFSDWKRCWLSIARTAERDGRLLSAAFSYRAAEFFTYSTDPDKDRLYDKFITLFDECLRDVPLERCEIPYEGGALHAVRLRPARAKGTVVIHGGGDSFAEELYSEMVPLYDAGYDVVNFEGPGQGKVLHKHHIPYTHQWERPTGAVLDELGLDDVTLIGVSMGSWMCLRAAAFEPRIRRVVSWSGAYDIWDCHLRRLPRAPRLLLRALFAIRAKRIIDALLQRARAKNSFADWAYDHGLYSFGKSSLYEYFSCWRYYRPQHLHTERIDQDVLLLAGQADHFIPVEMMLELERNLSRARSVEHRIFTEAEHAASHCQVGNLTLAMAEIIRWLDRHSEPTQHSTSSATCGTPPEASSAAPGAAA
jgi:pimeloyl-ACP methyl ester carboxylesterase